MTSGETEASCLAREAETKSPQPFSPLPPIEYAERSDPGREPKKQINEDACGGRETRFGHLSVVCDGMGGHAAGREAAQLALTTIFQVFEGAPEGSPPSGVLRLAIEEASRRVYRAYDNTFGHPGSTVAAVLLHAHGTEVAHVGDSRAYLVQEKEILQLTRDHSIVQELVDRGLLRADEAAEHPVANRITRALGTVPEVEVDLRPQAVRHASNDAFVLCSDGLSDLVSEQEILAVVSSEPAARAVGTLVDLANARGGHDNVTVVVLRAREAALALPAEEAPPLSLPRTRTPQPQTGQATRAGAAVVETHGAGRTIAPSLPAESPGAVAGETADTHGSKLDPVAPARASPMLRVVLVLAAIGGAAALYDTCRQPTAEPRASIAAVSPQSPDRGALDEGNRLRAAGNCEAAHNRVEALNPGSPLRTTQAFRDIENCWADDILGRVERAPGLADGRALLQRVLQSASVDDARRRASGDRLLDLDVAMNTPVGTDPKSLPAAPSAAKADTGATAGLNLNGGRRRSPVGADSSIPSGPPLEPSPNSSAPVFMVPGPDDAERALRGVKPGARKVYQAQLERKVYGGGASDAEINLLIALCSELGDKRCQQRVRAIKTQRDLVPLEPTQGVQVPRAPGAH